MAETHPGGLDGTVLIVGTTDTGKSTLARWLFAEAYSCGRKAAWLDGDLGQSRLGIPGTLNIVTGAAEPRGEMERTAFFVGSNSPRGHMLPALTGLCRLRDRARTRGAESVFIDTSGLVAEESGGGAELLRAGDLLFSRGEEE